MQLRRLGRAGPLVTPLGFGAVKIGRNAGVKYRKPYNLPSDIEVAELLRGLRDLGVNYIDTAPAYGISEVRLGVGLAPHRGEFLVSTKVGESFEQGRSHFDFSRASVEQSVERSLMNLRTDALDVVFIHSHGDDLEILHHTDLVETLQRLRSKGTIRQIGLSGKTVAGAMEALDWADCLMVEYHLDDRSHEPVIAAAASLGIGIVVKKPLAAGRLPPAEALRFVLANPGVSSAVVGSLSLDHLRANVQAISGPMIDWPITGN